MEVSETWRKRKLSVRIVVARESGWMGFDTHLREKCNGTSAQSVRIGFRARTTLLPRLFLFFLILIKRRSQTVLGFGCWSSFECVRCRGIVT